MHYAELNGQAKIDDIDQQIIKILNGDGRTPFAQIAKRLGVSTGMIRQRYHRLVQDGVLQVVAITNPLLMGVRGKGFPHKTITQQTTLNIFCKKMENLYY